MTQPQVPLQLNNKETCRFDDFIGSEEVVDSLINYPKLPLLTFLWGAQYTGKSFLVAALYDLLQSDEKKVMVLDAIKVADQNLVEYVLSGHDFLLIEDIQQLSGKMELETALFNLYNACHRKQTKLLLTSEFSQLDERWQLPDLRSRLSSGLVLSLETLKNEDALRCIQRLFEQSGMPLEDTVINYLKSTQNTSLSNLFPLFRQLTIDTLKLKRKVTIPMVKHALLNIKQSES